MVQRMKFSQDPEMTTRVRNVVSELGGAASIHLSIAKSNVRGYAYAGWRDLTPIYPASLTKLYIAAALLEYMKRTRTRWDRRIYVVKKNAVDEKPEVASDTRPLLEGGAFSTLEVLLDLMITRSDNTAANVLIDFVGREEVNKLLRKHGWEKSALTRKFLSRKLEDLPYQDAPMVQGYTRHLAEFLCLVDNGTLLGVDSSQRLSRLLQKQRDNGKLRAGLPSSTPFYHKTGWWTDPGNPHVGVVGDCGVTCFDGSDSCIVAVIVSIPGEKGEQILTEIGRRLQYIVTGK